MELSPVFLSHFVELEESDVHVFKLLVNVWEDVKMH